MISDAILSLAPGALWSMIDEDYATLQWNPSNPIQKPSLEEVLAEEARLNTIAESLKYQQLRKNEYPSIADQLDTLYHGGYDAWKAQIQAIKDQFPKP